MTSNAGAHSVTDRDEACLVCGGKGLHPLYKSPHAISLTSALLLVTTTTFVSACGSCAHVQTRPIEAITQYYDAGYNFQVESQEEDDLYRVEEGRIIYRSAHQARVIDEKIDLSAQQRVLDF